MTAPEAPLNYNRHLGLVVRGAGAVALLALVVANLDTVDVNLILVSFPVPAALLVAAPTAAGAFVALRWKAACMAADRARRVRRREMDILLGRRSPRPVRH